MPRYLILAQSQVTARSFGAWLELLTEASLDGTPQCIVWDRPLGGTYFLEGYSRVAGRVEDAVRRNDDTTALNAVIALVDSVTPSQMSVVEERGGWDSLVATLVLTFPEVHWVFGVCNDVEEPRWWTSHSLPTLLTSDRRDPLFDPTDLRGWIRERTNEGLRVVDDLCLPTRGKLAAAIDEELPYAYLHGYTAYRFGFRTDVVTTWGAMKARFHCLDSCKSELGSNYDQHDYWLLLEDMSLNFPDKPNSVHLLMLKGERDCCCPTLDSTNDLVEKSEFRVLVTTGQSRQGDSAYTANRIYLTRDKVQGRGNALLKPASGMFDLWEKVGLLRKPVLDTYSKEEYLQYVAYRKHRGIPRVGNAPGFFWPPSPQPKVAGYQPMERRGHGAPGKLLLVSNKLLERAEGLRSKVKSVGDAVFGATLATDALELTGDRTPTTAIEALSLKHQFEVLAECQFSGVEHHIHVKPRLDEIALETDAICRWFDKGQQEKATLNARLHILNSVVKILRDNNQFDEEQVCMSRVRRLHSTLWMRAQSWRFIFWPFIRYVEVLLSSMLAFVSVVVGWLFVLAALFAWVDPGSGALGIARLQLGIESAVTSFFSVGPPIHHGGASDSFTVGQIFVIAGSIVSGFLHLGVLISHLYTVASRR